MGLLRLRLLPSALALAAAALLAGCASGPGATPAPTSTVGADAGGHDSMDVEAAWLDDGRAFAVVTWGSSSCVPRVDDVASDGQTVTVTLIDGMEEACTDDLTPRAAFAALPQGVDASQEVALIVHHGELTGTADLDGLADPADPGPSFGEEPSAGWFDDQGIALLTYGSSSCRPQVHDVEQTEGGATVTFAEITGVCTADMAPRVTVITLPSEVDDDEPFELTLTGGGLDAQVPVS